MTMVQENSRPHTAVDTSRPMPVRTGNDAPSLLLETAIGNTPMIELKGIGRPVPPGVRVFGKAEWFNPGGSVKDRPALAMIRDGERRELLTPDRILIDATSGNTGIAYAMLCAARGYHCTLAMPANAGPERRKILSILGAELIMTDPMEGGTDEAQRIAREIAERAPERYFYADQYNNPANWRSHYDTTAIEIWRQTQGSVTHFVAGLGTTGTFTGASRRLKELKPDTQCIAFQPDSPLHGLEGIKHLATARVPGIYDPLLADAVETVSTDEAYATARSLARRQGIFVGPSGGAAAAVALRVACRLERGVVVTVLSDGGTRYLSDRFWEGR